MFIKSSKIERTRNEERGDVRLMAENPSFRMLKAAVTFVCFFNLPDSKFCFVFKYFLNF